MALLKYVYTCYTGQANPRFFLIKTGTFIKSSQSVFTL